MAVEIAVGSLHEGGACLEASDGTKLAVFQRVDGSVSLWKDIDGTPSQQDSDQTATTVFGGGSMGWLHAAIDSSDNIHIVASCTSEQTRDVAYCLATESGGSWTFGTWEEALDYTQQAPSIPGCAISIDSNDKPHILAVDSVKQGGSTQDNVYWVEKTGASWSTPLKIGSRGTKTFYYRYPHISLKGSDYVEFCYFAFTTSNYVGHREYTSSLQGETIYRNNGGGTWIGYPGVTVTSGETVYRYNSNTADNIWEDQNDTGYDQKASTYVSPCLDGTDRYIFYIDTGDDVHLISNTGSGWTDEGDLQTGTYEWVKSGWSYNNYNTAGELIYIYDDGTNVYYDSFPLAPGDVVETDGVTIGDTPTVSIDLAISVSDGLAVGDAETVDPPEFDVRLVSELDNIDIGEVVSAELDDLVISVSSGLTVGDTETIIPDLAINVSDGLTVGESFIVYRPGIIFFDDFETGDFSRWGRTFGSPTVGTDYKITDSYGMKADQNVTEFAEQNENYGGGIPLYSDRYRMRFYFRWFQLTPDATVQRVILAIQNAVSNPRIYLYVWDNNEDPDTQMFRLRYWDDTPSLIWGPITVIPKDRVVGFEMLNIRETGGVGEDGTITVWVNDVLQYTISDLDNSNQFGNLLGLAFGSTISGETTDADIWIDDIVFRDDDTYIGTDLFVLDAEDTVGVVDAASIEDHLVFPADNIGVGEFVNVAIASDVSETDGVTIGEIVSVDLVPLISESDNVTVGDSETVDTWVIPTDIDIAEAHALKWLYDNTDGPNWTDSTNWGETATADNWYGITVATGHVTDIDLNTNALNGSITNWAIDDLDWLQRLFLYSNASLAGDLGGWTLPTPMTHIRIELTGVSGNVGNWTLPTGLIYLQLYNTTVSGDVSGWTLPTTLEYFRIYNGTNISGDISGWTLPSGLIVFLAFGNSLSGNLTSWSLPSTLVLLYLNTNSFTGSVSSWTIPAGMTNFRVNGNSLSGVPDLDSAVSLATVHVYNLGLTQTEVDLWMVRLWNNRADFTDTTPDLLIHGTNAAPSGVYRDADPPYFGAEYAYELENDPETEGFNVWAITFTSISSPSVAEYDSLTIGESVSVVLVPLISETDGVTVGEIISVALADLGIDVTSGLTVGDSETVVVEDEGDRNITETDGVTVGEIVSLALDDLAVFVTSGLTIGDTESVILASLISETDGVTVGESIDVHVQAAWYHPESITENVGAVVSGEISDTWSDDGTRLQLSEVTGTPGFSYDFDFYDVPATAFSVAINGYYEGNPAHNAKIRQYNFTTTLWTDLSPDDDDFPSDTSDYDTEFHLFGGPNYNDGGNVRLRIIHTSSGNPLHNFYIDLFQMNTHLVVHVNADLTVGEVTSVSLDDLAVTSTDGLTIGEVVQRLLEALVVELDDVALGEIVTTALDNLEVTETDGVTIGEIITARLEAFISVIDGVTVGEIVTLNLGIEINVTDGLDVGDVLSAILVHVTAQIDGVTVGEIVNITLDDLLVSVTSGLVVGDEPTVIVSEEGVRYIVEADNITIGEIITVALSDMAVDEIDGITVGEIATVEAPREPAVSDNLDVGEIITVSLDALAVSETDDIAVGDTPAVETDTFIVETDGITVGEIVSVSIGDLLVNETDNITLGEIPDVSILEAGVIGIVESDDLLLGEIVTVTLSDLEVFETDGVAVGDSETVSIGAISFLEVTETDGVAVGEVYTVEIPPGIAETDTIALGEITILTISDPQVSVTDGLLVDDVAYLQHSSFNYYLSVSDNLTLAESITALAFLSTTPDSVVVKVEREPRSLVINQEERTVDIEW